MGDTKPRSIERDRGLRRASRALSLKDMNMAKSQTKLRPSTLSAG